MKCLLCNKEMELKDYEGVTIDVCNNCGGVWLDKDELGKIVRTEEVKFKPEDIKKALDDSKQEKAKREELMRSIMSVKKDVNLEGLSTEEILETFQKRWG